MLFQTFFWYWVYLISARSQPECTNKYIEQEPERQHRLGILSEHLYDSISDPTVHTYLALCSQYLKLNIITKKVFLYSVRNQNCMISSEMSMYDINRIKHLCVCLKYEDRK